MKAVILAGGLGVRLRPFTQVIPKPLLPIGESSVLEIQILTLKKYGVTDIFIATNYMSEYVRAFVASNKELGINIHFSQESKPLGTCGPVALLKKELTEPFLLMNGDILTTLDFKSAYDFTEQCNSNLIVVTKEITTPFHFGNVEIDGDYIVNVREKPNFKLEILSGIYFMKPEIFNLIPEDTYFGIPDLIKGMLAKKMKIGRYLMTEYWLDIGQITDYESAQSAYKEHFIRLKDS